MLFYLELKLQVNWSLVKAYKFTGGREKISKNDIWTISDGKIVNKTKISYFPYIN
jgi:hypothetical protein